MGSWDCYCAICAVSMRPIEIRDHPPRPPPSSNKKSQSPVEREAEHGQGKGGNIVKEDERERANDKGDGEENEEWHGHEDSDDDEVGYDPTVVSPQEVEWTLNCRGLGFNPSCNGAFVTGPGYYEYYGGMTCDHDGDPNSEAVEVLALGCYYDEGERMALFPFHWDCSTILWRRLTGSKDRSRVNMHALYNAMHGSFHNNAPVLNLTYTLDRTDDDMPNNQWWEFNVGEEHYVSSPLQTSKTTALMKTEFQRPWTLPALDSALHQKIRSDPFTRIPREIGDQIISYLDHETMMYLLQASWMLHSNVHQSNSFWRQRVKIDMPWFFELHEYLDSEDSRRTDSIKALYLWAHKTIMPRKYLRLPYTVVANRRRIWAVCDQIADLYDAALLVLKSEPQMIYSENSRGKEPEQWRDRCLVQ